MKKITSYNFRKIIGLSFIGLVTIMIFIPLVLKLPITNQTLLRSMFNNTLDATTRTAFIIYGAISVICLILTLTSIVFYLKKGRRTQYGFQAIVTILLVALCIYNRTNSLLSGAQVALYVIALVLNILSSVYYILCIVFNYDEMYFVPTVIYEDEVAKEEAAIENKEE